LDSETVCMRDEDLDGYGKANFFNSGTDCDDNNASKVPVDLDGDGYSTCTNDCDDQNDRIFPGAAYIDLPTACVLDFDLDGYASVLNGGTDCNDTDAGVNPIQVDYMGDNLDQNCDGHDGVDGDGDGQASIASGGVDCNDTDILIHDLDLDGDGDGICSGDCDDNLITANLLDVDNDGYSTCDGDCDDQDQSMYPGAAELDSTTACLRDADDDGYGDITAFNAGSDCDDQDAAFNQDDVDLDGFTSCAGDCQDYDPAIFPTLYQGNLVCLAPEIEVTLSETSLSRALGCTGSIPVLIENTGDDDLIISSMSLSDETGMTLETLSYLNGNFPWVLPPGEFTSVYLQSEDVAPGVYTSDLSIESNSIYNNLIQESVTLSVYSAGTVQSNYVFGESVPQTYVMIVDGEVADQNDTDIASFITTFADVIGALNSEADIMFVMEESGCAHTAPMPISDLDLQYVNTTLTTYTAAIDSLTTLTNFAQELDDGCNQGMMTTAQSLIPVIIDANTETATAEVSASLDADLASFTVPNVVLFQDVSQSCNGESQTVLSNALSNYSLLSADICHLNTELWSVIPQLVVVENNTVPVDSTAWNPSVSVVYNGVELGSGWTQGEEGIILASTPALGSTLDISYQLGEVCP